MVTLIAVPLTCWLCALIALPRKSLRGNETAELVYARLLGRHQCLIVVAVVVSALAFFALVLSVPERVDADLQAQRAARWRGDAVPETAVFCSDQSSGGRC